MASLATLMKIAVVVHPNAKNPRIETVPPDVLHVYVSQSPLEGNANKAVTQALAAHFHTKKANVTLVSGAKSRSKLYEITVA